MDFRFEIHEGRLIASGDMTIYQAAGLKDALQLNWPAVNGSLRLDLSNVSELDTCGLQLILMLLRRARAEGVEFVVIEPSEAVREVLDLCGLHGLYRAERKAA
jgi:anti-sigma B factor antagonist